MITQIIIPNEIQEKIIAHSLKNYPKEACGILAGKGGQAEIIYPLINISENPELCYLIDAKEQLKVFKEIRAKSLEITAIYHSHTHTEAYPSAKDLELAFYPDSFYVIVTLADKNKPKIRAFKIIEGKIKELNIKEKETNG